MAESEIDQVSPWPTPADLVVPALGPGRHPSRLGCAAAQFVDEEDGVVIPSRLGDLESLRKGGHTVPAFESAG